MNFPQFQGSACIFTLYTHLISALNWPILQISEWQRETLFLSVHFVFFLERINNTKMRIVIFCLTFIPNLFDWLSFVKHKRRMFTLLFSIQWNLNWNGGFRTPKSQIRLPCYMIEVIWWATCLNLLFYFMNDLSYSQTAFPFAVALKSISVMRLNQLTEHKFNWDFRAMTEGRIFNDWLTKFEAVLMTFGLQ